MIWRRWHLVASSVDPTDEFQCGLAEAFNRDANRFWFKLSAREAAWFYKRRLELPLDWEVVRGR